MANLTRSLDELMEDEKRDRPWSAEVMNLEVMEFLQINQPDFSFLGERYSEEISCRIADADIHPVTLTEFDPNFAEALTYVPIVPMRTNSIIANATQFNSKNRARSGGQFHKEAQLMNKFLTDPNKSVG